MNSPHFLSSSLLQRHGFGHAFFCRQGGVSSGPFASLNFSISVGDTSSAVQQNFASAAAVLGVAPGALQILSQVHGRVVLEADPTSTLFTLKEGDGLTSANPQLACGVRSADCVPILLADRRTGRVAALHAGWRGVVANIISVGTTALNGKPQDYIAAIGPHISETAFEVGLDVAEQLKNCSSERNVARPQGSDKALVNLRQICRQQLRDAGVAALDIDDVFGCTFSDAENFFSFRRDGAVGGRHLSAIRPR